MKVKHQTVALIPAFSEVGQASRHHRSARFAVSIIRTIALAAPVSLLAIIAGAAPAHADGGLLAWPKDHVYVVDQTGGGWPVERAAANLGANSPLDLTRVTSCPSGGQCIYLKVKSIPGQQDGYTSWSYVNGHDITTATVWLDSWQTNRLSARNELGLTTHELGHAIGLPHSTSKSSIMYPYYMVAPSRPSAGDFSHINTRY